MTGLFDLTGRRALVTGGATGLGRMIAEGLLHAGAAVTITSRDADAVAAAAAELCAIGPATGIASDLSSPSAAVALAQAFRAGGDALDILVNNAGKTWGAPFEQFPDKAWPSIMAVNVQMPFKLAQELLPELERAGGRGDPARIINIGSIGGKVVEPLNAYSYIASKAAIHHLTRQMAADLASRNITVNAVVPGFFPTRMTAHLREESSGEQSATEKRIPLGRFGRPEDIAGAIVFLSSRAGSYMTGAELVIDGGLSGCA